MMVLVSPNPSCPVRSFLPCPVWLGGGGGDLGGNAAVVTVSQPAAAAAAAAVAVAVAVAAASGRLPDDGRSGGD